MRKILKTFFIILFLFLGIILLLNFNSVNAASFSSDIDGIDESKYPGYKEKIKQLQKTYPNIQVLYTGLDWNTAVYNEYSETHGRNLVDPDLDDSWLCQECKNAGKLYDSGLACASADAVRYIMDPRNSLTQTGIFQFQKLNTSVGTDPNEISLILNMEHVNYLKNDQNAIQAFANVAKNNNLNAYFLVSRVIQEQGRAPTSPLATGAGYTGNGYTDYGKGYYNLFSIGASGSGYMVRVNGLTRAMNEGWDSLAKSIEGGGNFVGESYIDVGQNTLYLQKFSVYNTNGQLYWHQYMQNLFGAQSEADILYSLYRVTGIQNSKDFVFIVPIYENMPSEPCKEPTAEYEADIGTEVISSEIYRDEANNGFFSGHINVSEFVKTSNGVEWQIPRNVPLMRLKTESGKYVQDIYVEQVDSGRNEYYFDFPIDDLDVNQKYVIEVELDGKNNLSKYKTANASYTKDINLGRNLRYNVNIVSGKIKFTNTNYTGDIGTGLENFEMAKNDEGETYIYGDVIINEWIDGKALIPDALPTITVKTEDGKEVFEAWVNNIGGNKYHFDTYIEGIDASKKYVIEASLENTYNTSKYKSSNILSGQNKSLGTYDEYKVALKDGKFVFDLITYTGDIGTEVIALYLNENAKGEHYISGNIYITEWINGTTWSVPKKTPIIRIKTIEGEIKKEAWVNNIGGNEYYFDSYIEGIDTSKEYVIEVELANVGNISKNKKGNAYFGSDMNLGEYSGKEMKVESGKIVFRTNEYSADLGQSLDWIELHENENKEKYINGNIYITEWVNGTTWSEPKELPKIVIKAEEGEEVKECWVSKVEGNKYYFDSYIEGIDVNKEYEIEVELQGNNASKYKSGKVDFGKEKLLGEYKETRVKVKGTKIRFESEKYSADLGQTIDWIELNENGNKEKYINGNIYITEWINGTTWSEPKELPKIVIKTEEGELVKECYVSKLEGNKYYFDSYIEGIDTSKRYVLEVELTNSNNTSKNKVGKVDLGEEKVLGEYKDYTLKVEGTTMEFEAKVKAVEKQENNNQVVNSPIKGEEKIVVKENEESKKEETKSIENTTNEVTENEKEEEKPEENKTDKEDETTENEVENNTMTNVIELNETRQNKTNKNITE